MLEYIKDGERIVMRVSPPPPSASGIPVNYGPEYQLILNWNPEYY